MFGAAQAQMQQMNQNVNSPEASALISQKSNQISEAVQDMTNYTGLNSSLNDRTAQLIPAIDISNQLQGHLNDQYANQNPWNNREILANVSNQTPQNHGLMQSMAKSPNRCSSSKSKTQPSAPFSANQISQVDSEEILHYPRFLNSYKCPQKDRESSRGRAISQNKQSASDKLAEPLYSYCYVWGSDKQGQLGQNQTKKVFQAPKACIFGLQGPNNLDFKIRLKKVSCGETHTAMLSSEGLLYMLGNAQGGKLGIPNMKNTEVRQPTLIEDLIPTQSLDQSGQPFKNQVVDVVCAVTYTLAVTQSGHVFSWGTSIHGALGLGDKIKSIDKPTLIDSLVYQQADIIKVDAKYNHSVFLSNGGKVYMVGNGEKGQLGMAPPHVQNINYQQSFNQYSLIPPSISSNSQIGNVDQSQKSNPFCLYQPVHVECLSQFKIIDAAVGKDFSLFLTHTRHVLSFGANHQGQLGLGETQEIHCDPVQIPTLANIIKIDCNEGSIALDNQGKMFLWGPVNRDKVLVAPQKVSNINQKIVNCSIGKFSYSAIDCNSMVWVWGENKHAQLGLNDYTARSTPYPLLSLKDKQISSLQFGVNFGIAFRNNQDPNQNQLDLLSCRNSNNSQLNQNPNFVLVSSQTKSALSALLDNFNHSGSKNLLLTPMFNNRQNHKSDSHDKAQRQSQLGPFPEQMKKQNTRNMTQQNTSNGDQLLNQQQYLQQMNQVFLSQAEPRIESYKQYNMHHAQSQQVQCQTMESAPQQLQSNQHLTSYMTPSNHFAGSNPSGSLSGAFINIQGESNRSSCFQTQSLQQNNGSNYNPYVQAQMGMQKPYEQTSVQSNLLGNKIPLPILKKNSVNKQERGSDLEGALTSSEQEDDSNKFQMQPQALTSDQNSYDPASRGHTLHTATNQSESLLKERVEERRIIKEFEDQLKQYEQERQLYKQEIQQLKIANMEQQENLNTMIQSVSELQETTVQHESQAKMKDEQMQRMKEDYEKQLIEVKTKSSTDLNMQIEQIDFLTKQIERLDDQFQGPKNEFLAEIEGKSQQIYKLEANLSAKQKDIIAMQSEIDRYKIQINSLNQKISDQEVEISEYKKNEVNSSNQAAFKKLQQDYDFTVNLNQCQKLTIEKLENRILVLDNEKNDKTQQQQTDELERAQLQRKVITLENQLKFEKNINDDTKKEIYKLDKEIAQAAENCSNREQILQKKLEDQMELYRKEKVQSAALKGEIMQKDNLIEKLRTQIRQCQADTKLAKLETEAIVKQCEYERQGVGKQVRDNRLGQMRSPGPQQANLEQSMTNLGDSYIDISYSYSPSLIQTQSRRNISSNQQVASQDQIKDSFQENRNYNQHLLRNIQKKTIGPLVNDYQANIAHKKRAMELADKTAEQSLKLKVFQSSDQTDTPRKMDNSRNYRQKKSDDPNDEFEQFNMKNQSLKYNQRVTQNISRLIVGKDDDQESKQLTYGPRYKRNKSADPFSAVGAVAANKAICNRSNRSNSGSRGGQGEQKQPTYIQKLLGLNRTSSASSNQYPFSIPPWQQLLKNKQDTLASMNQANNNYSYDHKNQTKQMDMAHTRNGTSLRGQQSATIQNEEMRDVKIVSKAVSNSYGYNEETISVGDIGNINKDSKRNTILMSEDGIREKSVNHTDYADLNDQRTIYTEKH